MWVPYVRRAIQYRKIEGKRKRVEGWQVLAIKLDAVLATTAALLNEKPKIQRLDRHVIEKREMAFLRDPFITYGQTPETRALMSSDIRGAVAAARAYCDSLNRKEKHDASKD